MLVAAFRALSEDGQGRSCDGYEVMSGVSSRLCVRQRQNRADVRATLRSNWRRVEEVVSRRPRELRTSNGVMKRQLLLPIDGAAAADVLHLVVSSERTGARWHVPRRHVAVCKY